MRARSAEEYAAAIKHLPPALPLVNNLLTMFRNPDCDLDKVVTLVAHDPALTAEILKRCNSAMLAIDHPISDIFEAVMRLGLYEVYCIAVGMCRLDHTMFPGVEKILPLKQEWEHSMSAAAAAVSVAKLVQASPSEAFIAGLLHDIGKLVLAASDPGSYRLALTKAGNEPWALDQAEREFFGVDHAAVGGCLLARWGLAEEVAAAVHYHHTPAASMLHQRQTAIIFVADTIAYQADSDTLQPCWSSPEIKRAFDLLELSEPDLPQILDDTARHLLRVRALIQG